jgi:hypothetical protein
MYSLEGAGVPDPEPRGPQPEMIMIKRKIRRDPNVRIEKIIAENEGAARRSTGLLLRFRLKSKYGK